MNDVASQRPLTLGDRRMQWPLTVIFLASTALSYWGFQSLDPSLEGKVLASILSVATFCCLSLYNRFVIEALNGRAALANRVGVLGLALVFSLAVVGLSSAINVAALSGKAAQRTYLQDVAQQLAAAKSARYRQAQAVRQFLPVFASEQRAWAQAATDEHQHGAYSGSAGTGAVHTTLSHYAQSFAGLHAKLVQFLTQVDTLNAQADAELLTLRQRIGEALPAEARHKRVAQQVDRLAALLATLQGRDVIDGVQITVRNFPSALQGITLSRHPQVAKGQQAAIDKMTARLAASGAVLDKAFAHYQQPPAPPLPTLRPMSTLRAVIHYGHLFPQSWLAGLALDFLPLFLALVGLVLNLGKSAEEKRNDQRMAITVGEIINYELTKKQLAQIPRAGAALEQINKTYLGVDTDAATPPRPPTAQVRADKGNAHE